MLDTDGFDETRSEMSATANFSIYAAESLRKDLDALEWILTTEQPPGLLLYLVEIDANISLDDPTDAGAAVILRQVAAILNEVLDEAGHR